MKKIKIILIVLLFAANIHAQYNGASLGAGIGTYQLNDLKLLQDELIAFAPVSGKGFTYFPMYSHVRLDVYRKFENAMKYGLSYSYSNTGAHANYGDYSGIMNIDQLVTSHQLGAVIFYPLLYQGSFEFLPYGRIMIGYTRNWVTREIIGSYYSQTTGLRMRTFSPAAEVGLEAIYHFDTYSFGIEAGYQYDLGGKLKIAENDMENAEILMIDRQVRSNMSGLRINAKLMIRFEYESSTE